MKQPVCLPTQEVEGVMLTRWACREAWVSMLLAGRVDSPQVDTASGQVRMRLMEALRTAARPQDKELMTAACAGRAALCLDDDSDLDGSPPGEGCKPAGRAGAWRRGSARPAAPGIVPIRLGLVPVRAAVLRRVLWVESSPEAMSAIAEAVSKELVPPALRAARERARVMRAEAQGCQPEGFKVAGESLHGKVHFSSDKQSWVAVYVSETGRRSFTVKGLGVPTKDPFGVTLEEEAYLAGMRAKLQRAKEQWNALDKSERERIPIC